MNLLRVYIAEHHQFGVEISPWVWIGLTVLLAGFLIWRRYDKPIHVVEVNIQLGGIGQVRLTPTWEDVQIAHRIWTELVTRKAAVTIDPDHDVILEVYDSWYALFQRIRQLVSDIPARCVRREKSTQLLVRIATDTLNLGLRPHLTSWQARFRNWWRNTDSALKERTPQEHQKQFPHYDELLTDMQRVNKLLIEYAAELQKIVRG